MCLLKMNFKKLQKYGSSLFISQRYLNNDGSQNYLIFQPTFKTVTTFSGLPNIIAT